MNSKIQIDQVVIGRFPRFSLSFQKELIENHQISDELLISILKNPIFQEALLIADPTFFNTCQLFTTGKLNAKKKKSVRMSLVRYALRSSSRSTPFGLFAGVSCGSVSNQQTEITLKEPECIVRKGRFDFSILIQLAKNIEKDPEFYDKIKWTPNTTLYKFADEWRYFKAQEDSNKQEYNLDGFLNSDKIFDDIFLFAKTGKYRKELIQFLIDDGFNKSDSLSYINDLISSQILVSELHPTLTVDFFEKIKEIVRRENKSLQILDSLASTIDSLDEKSQIRKFDLNQIKNVLRDNSFDYKSKHLYHIDYFQKTAKFNISRKAVWHTIQALEKVGIINSLRKQKSPLENFKKKFVERYGNRHICLTDALDIEYGLGALFTDKSFNSNSFLDDIHFPSIQSEHAKLVWDQKAKFLNKLLQDFFRNSSDTNGIDLNLISFLKQSHFENFSFNTNCSVLMSLMGVANDDPIYVEHALTTNTFALISRFGDLNPQIEQYLKRIVQRELSNDKITAEIVYLPENRTANVMRHPLFFEYEIPYLAQSGTEHSKQIFANDLYIHYTGGRFRLYSKRLNAEIKPVIGNAHNFLKHTLPVYRFLAVFGSDRNNYNFSWGALTKIYDFLPRVYFKNVILSLARWKCYTEQLNFKSINNSDMLFKNIQEWRKKNDIPQYIQIRKGDRVLPINLKNLDCINLFLNFINDKSEFIIEEYLFKSNSLNIQRPVSHANQILVSLYNE